MNNIPDNLQHPYVDPEECDCWKCEAPRYKWIDGHKTVMNNMEWHTYGQECDDCGAERTQYRDLGRKGRYVCPECG